MLRFVGRIVAAGLMLVAGATQAQVVISQVYGGGGNTGAPYRSDFIELHNNGNIAVDLTGWSVQYGSATGTTWQRTNLNGSIAPGAYYLIKQADGANTAATPLPTPDANGTIAMSGTAGKVVLLSSQTLLTGICPLAWNDNLDLVPPFVDAVGFGSANCSEFTPTPTLSNTTAAIRKGNGCADTDGNSFDFVVDAPTPRNSQTSAFLCNAGPLPVLTISDAAAPEGNGPGLTVFAPLFVTLSAPAGPGGVTFNANARAGTATAGAPGNPETDFFEQNWGGVIPEGQTTVAFTVPVIGDTRPEPDETFVITVFNVQGATIGDSVGIGTILNDDVNVVAIPEIQGSGATSPITGQIVTTEGIVTARKFNNGFFLQSANDDGNPATSEGIFVFTSSAPPSTAAVGNHVRVTGTVTEFTPSTNLNQLSITELVSVTSIQVISTGNSLPAPVELTSTDFGAGATPVTAEKYEGMRVSAGSAKVVAASDGNIDENDALSTTTGVFHVVLPDVARPFREAGIGILDTFPIPSGKNPPRFDANQERLMIRSRGQVGASALAVDVGADVGNLVGVLDYFSGTWTMLPDTGSTISVSGGKQPAAVADARYEDVTIGAFNLLRFFDEINDSNGAVTMTAAALDKRLTKTGSAICDYLKTPDILGVVEVENLRVLGLLAGRINATCARGPQYAPYLIQGNDVGGINVGFLVSTRNQLFSNRVEVLEISQFGKNTVMTNPNGSTSLLNDRPPLLLRARVNQDNGASYLVTVIVNHLRSLNGVDDTTAGSNGWATEGDRVRAKRAQQAVFLANLVHQRQQANPGERIVLLGDFNAFEFNDGYVDVMGIVRGDEAAEDQVVAYADSPITRPLIDGSELIVDPIEHYSYVFEGNAQTLDHVVINEPVVMGALDIKVDHARINADFGVHHYGETGNALRVSDHDPVRIAISVPEFRSANLEARIDSVNPASPRVGQTVSFAVTATNAGPNAAQFPAVSLLVFGPRTTTVNYTVAAPSGWTCGPSPIASDGFTTVAVCTADTLALNASASFTMSFVLTAETTAQTILFAAAVRSQTADPANANNTAFAQATVVADTDLSAQWTSVPSAPLIAGTQTGFILTARNLGPDPSWAPVIVFTADVPSGTLIANPTGQSDGWFCQPDFTSPTFRTVCEHQSFIPTIDSFPAGAVKTFSVSGTVPTADADGLNLTATISSRGTDPLQNNSDSVSVQVINARSDLSASLSGGPTVPFRSGTSSVFAMTLANAGPDAAMQPSVTLTGDAPAANIAIDAPAGWVCNLSDAGTGFEATCSTTETLAIGASVVFAVTVIAPVRDDDGLTLTATASLGIGEDPVAGNNSASRHERIVGAPRETPADPKPAPTPPGRNP